MSKPGLACLVCGEGDGEVIKLDERGFLIRHPGSLFPHRVRSDYVKPGARPELTHDELQWHYLEWAMQVNYARRVQQLATRAAP